MFIGKLLNRKKNGYARTNGYCWVSDVFAKQIVRWYMNGKNDFYF